MANIFPDLSLTAYRKVPFQEPKFIFSPDPSDHQTQAFPVKL